MQDDPETLIYWEELVHTILHGRGNLAIERQLQCALVVAYKKGREDADNEYCQV